MSSTSVSPKLEETAVMSESGSEVSKVEKKREYNRNAQRVFRQRRKEHLSKLEAAQKDAASLQSEEIERLRNENFALSQENEALRMTYGSAGSSPGIPGSSADPKHSPSYQLSLHSAMNSLETAVAMSNMSPGMGQSALSNPNNLVVVVPNNIHELRRRLHQMFAPVLEIPVISDPQAHLAALAGLAPSLPTPLRPTALQLSTPHHAYVDLIPSPNLRDRLIAIGPAHCYAFLMQVCTLACDIEDTGQMTIWGEDWLNEISWEFSLPVLEQWGGWLLTDEWGRRANFWRRQRGQAVITAFE